MELNLKEQKYLSRKFKISIILSIMPFIFFLIFFLIYMPNISFFEMKNFAMEIINSFSSMENNSETIMCFIIFGLLGILFSYVIVIAPIFSIFHKLKCLIKLKTHTYGISSTNLLEKYSIKTSTNNKTKRHYYGVVFNGEKNIKIKMDAYHFYNLNKGDNILVVSFGRKRKDYFILNRNIIENFTIGGFMNGTNNINF